ncbi:MAG: ATP-binding protein [Nitriliruptoraceae bacterium]
MDELLDELGIPSHTVLVIVDGQLVTGSVILDDDADVEIRPVISGGSDSRTQCVVCRGPAIIEEPRHRSAWCGDHFGEHVMGQVRKAIDQSPGDPQNGRMFSYSDRVLLAVSGGKDSLALWDILVRLGYHVDGVYIGLGIGGYSDRSRQQCEEFADQRALNLHVIDLPDEFGYTTPSGARATGRSPCSVCGLSKRYLFNRAAVDLGYEVVATGHNLDDEAATLLGNLARWNEDFLIRQQPVLASTGANQVRKVKPLYRLSEREIAAYCVVRGIDYVVEECPLVEGNTGIEYKQALDVLEAATPGVKAQFLFGFLDRRQRWFGEDGPQRVTIDECDECGMPTVGTTCAFCRQQVHITRALPIVAATAPDGASASLSGAS